MAKNNTLWPTTYSVLNTQKHNHTRALCSNQPSHWHVCEDQSHCQQTFLSSQLQPNKEFEMRDYLVEKSFFCAVCKIIGNRWAAISVFFATFAALTHIEIDK